MQDLIDFIRARLDEDASIAAGASRTSPHWRSGWAEDVETVPASGETFGRKIADGIYTLSDPEPMSPADAEHIARHDPARVLAEVAAKRRMVENLEAVQLEQPALRELRGPLAEVTLRMLALPYADHPDYREEWRP